MAFRRLAPILSLLIASLSLTALVAAEVFGTIESCSGCALNKLPILKSFLKDGEAESYRNVEVTFVAHRKAILTIWEGEGSEREGWSKVEGEKIVLSDYKTKEEMHALMVEKGFQLKPEEEIEAMKILKQNEKAEEKVRKDEQLKRKRERRENENQKEEERRARIVEERKKKEEEWKQLSPEEQRLANERGEREKREKEKREDVRGKIAAEHERQEGQRMEREQQQRMEKEQAEMKVGMGEL